MVFLKFRKEAKHLMKQRSAEKQKSDDKNKNLRVPEKMGYILLFCPGENPEPYFVCV